MIDSERDLVPGARSVDEALAADPLYRVFGRHLANPWLLGTALFLVVLAMIVFGPSTESRFIYTDF